MSQQRYRGPLGRIVLMTLPIGLVAAGLVAAPAQAGAVHAKTIYEAGTGRLIYTAAASDADNDVTLAISPTGGFTITDRGSPIDMDAGAAQVCTRLAVNSLRCAILGLTYIHAVLGQGDDRWEQSYPTVPSTVEGGVGNDVLYGGNAVDNLAAGPGNDELRGSGGDDNLYGEEGNDELHGNDGGDNLYGYTGTDEIYGENGNDKGFGGAGNDHLYGENGNDVLEGDDGYNTITGGAGNDTLTSGSGLLHGNDGNDKINGGSESYGDAGNDVLTVAGETFGGAGTDTLDLSGRSSAYRVSLDNQANDRFLPVCDNPAGCPAVPQQNAHDDIEIVLGTAYNDELTGNAKANDLRGGGGNDKIWGLDGDDKLDAQAGTNQHLNGGNGQDSCFGAGTLHYSSCEIR